MRRAREETSRALKAAQCRLNAWRLRPDIRSTGQATWGPAPRRGLSAVACAPPAQPRGFQAEVRAVDEPTARLPRLAQALPEQGHTRRLQPGGEALHALRGGPGPVAVPVSADLGDRPRVDHPRQRMRDLGLTPAEDASGERRRQGSITTTGPTQARHALAEGAWASRSPANVSRHRQLRLEKRPNTAQDLSWKAHGRLCPRSRRLSARGNHPHQVVGALARDLVAVRGAMANEVPVTSSNAGIPFAERSNACHRQRRGPGGGCPATA